MWHIGIQGSRCESPPSAGLRLEDRAAEGVFRVSNPTAADITLYYDVASSFGDYQMLFIRFRDRSGNLLNERYEDCGWWSPKEYHSNLYEPGEWPERQSLTIPAGGSLDIRRDVEALTRWLLWANREGPSADGPCEIQVRLYGYLEPQTWEGVSADSEWGPAPCPPVRSNAPG